MEQIDLKKYKAFLFDLNGTIIHDMPYHVDAWHKVVQSLGSNMSLDAMKQECYGKGEEMLERIFPGKYSITERIAISENKESNYRKEFINDLRLIEGLDLFLEKARLLDIKMGIGSAASNLNIDFVLDNLRIRNYMQTIISGEMVSKSKPHPETFLRCADLLKITAEDCLVFEDTPKGVHCAANAGMNAIVLTTTHPVSDFKAFSNIIQFVDDYTELSLY